MVRHASSGLLLLCVAVHPACRQEASVPETSFAAVRVTPSLEAGALPVLLNQELTVYFSAPVDPLTVTSDTVYVLDCTGRRVPGQLRAGSQSASFAPIPPLRPDLEDGSFRPDQDYRLVIGGYPRRDAVRARDGRALDAVQVRGFRTVTRDASQFGFASPLLPVGSGLRPFLLRQGDAPGRLPADAGILRLQFTAPVLPTTLRAEAFAISLFPRRAAAGPRRIVPRDVRLLSQPPPVDEYPGCTVEIYIGSAPMVVDEEEPAHIAAGDMVVVALQRGADALTDYAGREVAWPETPAIWWEVVPGESLAQAEWVAGPTVWLGDDPLLPAFEMLRDGSLRPRVRAEAGDGSLGVFRPMRDTELRPGLPFDRGDGVLVSSRGDAFPFLLIDVPEGVTVAVHGNGRPVSLQACGSVRIAGTLELRSEPVEVRVRHGERVSARVVSDGSAVVLVAAGDVAVLGRVHAASRAGGQAGQRSWLTLMAGGRIEVRGPVPPHTILAVEPGVQPVVGAAEQAIQVAVELTPGLPPGASLAVAAASPWSPLCGDKDRGVMRMEDRSEGLGVLVQFAAADPTRPGRPDPLPERWSHPRPVEDGSRVDFAPGSLARILVAARVEGGGALPQVRGIRVQAD